MSERLVRERMHVEDVPQEVESLARRARQVASIQPSKFGALKLNIQAATYEGAARTGRQGLTEVAQSLTNPLARAIILHEIIGPPLALRRPERTFADYG